MPSLLETLNALLIEHRVASSLASRIGGAEDDTAAAVGPALARIIDGLAALAAEEYGTDAVAHLVDHHDTPLADELDDFIERASTESGNVVLDRVFGAERGLVVIGLASALGLAPSLVGRLLPLLAPLVTAELARRRAVDHLDDVSVADLLTWDQRAIAQAGLLDGTTFDDPMVEGKAMGSTTVDGTTTGTDRPAVGGIDRQRIPDQRTAHTASNGAAPGSGSSHRRRPEGGQAEWSAIAKHDDVADEATGAGTVVTLEGVDGDVEAAAEPAAGTATAETSTAETTTTKENGTGTAETTSGAVPDGGSVDDVVVVDPAAEPEPDAGDAGDGEAAAGRPTDARGAALAWLGWAIGAVVLVLLLAWLLSTCGAATGDGQGERAATVMTVGPSEGGADAVEATSSTSSRSQVGPAAPATTEGSSQTEASLAGSVTEAELQGAVDVTLRDSGVTGTVVADRVTLTGVVADERSRDGLEAGISVLLGVAAIENRITIAPPAPPADPVPAGTTLNDLLALEPVTFTTGSADPTPEGGAVLDRVAAHLLEQPQLVVEIGGHTDDDGDESANLELSQQRADAVRRHLISAGVAGNRLTAIGFGEADPKVANDSLDNKAVNRRIEFTIAAIGG